MGAHAHDFKVHESTLRMMLKGMTVEQLRQAAHAPRALILIDDNDNETTGAELFEQWKYQCMDYKEDLHE